MTKLPSLAGLRSGNKVALSSALSALETAPYSKDAQALLNEAWAAPKAHVLGLTGPPGVGKSTLTSALVCSFREQGRSVGVIAIDPSSRTSGGALLGDRTRISTDPEDQGVFMRSMAARDQLGGLSSLTVSAMTLMRALFDIVIIETVGVGQSETDITLVADTVIFCVQPGSGDSLQFMKAGIMEVPHIAVVTKADLGKSAARALADLQGALSLTAQRTDGWVLRSLALSAQQNGKLYDLLEAIGAHWDWLQVSGRLEEQRQAQGADWVRRSLLERFGREGLAKLTNGIPPLKGHSPFALEAQLAQKLKRSS